MPPLLGQKDTSQEHTVSSFCVIAASAVHGGTRHILSAGGHKDRPSCSWPESSDEVRSSTLLCSADQGRDACHPIRMSARPMAKIK